MRDTPNRPKINANIFGRVKRSSKKIAASTRVMSGWILPKTEAIPAPVRPGLKNIAPKLRKVDIKPMIIIAPHSSRFGRNGCFCIRRNPSKMRPPMSARKPPNAKGGEYARPALIKVKQLAYMKLTTKMTSVLLRIKRLKKDHELPRIDTLCIG